MGYGSWTLKDGKWVSVSAHTTQSEPTTRPLGVPSLIIRNGGAEMRRKENLRKFDKPSEDQIKKLEQEDEAARAAKVDVVPIVREAKRDLETGKIKIHPGVLHNLNGKKYDKVVPYTKEVDDRGVTHVIPDKRSPEQLYEDMKKQYIKENVTASIGAPEGGSQPSPVEYKDVIEQALASVKGNRAKYRGNTIV